jgi:hypothetical protein
MTISNVLRSRFFVAGVIFLAAGILAVVWAMQFMDSIYAYRSPLRYKPPIAQEPLGHAVTQRLVIVLVDGLRDDTARDPALMPYLETLRSTGAWAVMSSRPLSYSQPGYSTLLIGAWPDINDGPAINLDLDKIPTWTQDNLFAAVRRQGGRTAIAASETFKKLIASPDINDSFYTSEANATGDDRIFSTVSGWLDAGGQTLLLVHLSQVDDAGDYLGGPKSDAWAEAAARVDGMIEEIGGKLDFTKDTLMIVSDHGQIDAGGHGGPEKVNLTEPFILVGAGVIPGFWGTMEMVDIAPTAAALLGASIPGTSQGRVLTHLVALDRTVAAALPAVVEAHQKQLYSYYTSAIGTSATLDAEEKDPVLKYQAGIERARENRLSVERMGRFFLVLAPILAAAFFAWKYRSRRLLERIGLFVVYAAVFTAVYMLVFQQVFSLSRVQTEGLMILGIAVSSAAGFLAAWLAAVYLRKFFTEGLEAIAEHTLALAGVFMALLSVPVLVHFFLNGTIARWTQPEMNTGFFALLAMMQIAALALFGGLLAGGSVLVKREIERRNAGEAGVEYRAAPVRKAPGERAVSARKRTGRGGGRKK